MKRAINWILRPDYLINLLWCTVEFKFGKNYVLLPFIILHTRQYNIVSSYVKEGKNWTTEERVVLSSAFKKVDCVSEREPKSKSAACYVLAILFLDPVSLLHHMIQNECSELDIKISLFSKTIATERLLKVD